MNEEKRKIGEYTVLCSVNVGEKEVPYESIYHDHRIEVPFWQQAF